MKTSFFLPALALLSLAQLALAKPAMADCPDFLRQEMRKLHSEKTVDLCQLTAGKPVLIVNTASHCGFTPQFKGLEALHQKYKDQGLVVLGFPSDDFFQEEDREQDTAKICFINYGVTFTMFATSAVWGSDVNPVFKYLGEKAGSPKWNFFKYLVSADGSEVTRFNSRVTPDDPALVSAIEAALAKHNKS
ncbi:glutathione peroxidase [Shewanella cyperi]|uniref:Glutathione peroxidase n=2 Tax=Shewanella cyperi TaxID=2814292 RepID=A0A974XM59_9GAMM|nr:glutathione peroxidase [Shewanella cyperi]QSX30967.1 glutathione peroxidase [Shewanella cyperi]